MTSEAHFIGCSPLSPEIFFSFFEDEKAAVQRGEVPVVGRRGVPGRGEEGRWWAAAKVGSAETPRALSQEAGRLVILQGVFRGDTQVLRPLRDSLISPLPPSNSSSWGTPSNSSSWGHTAAQPPGIHPRRRRSVPLAHSHTWVRTTYVAAADAGHCRQRPTRRLSSSFSPP